MKAKLPWDPTNIWRLDWDDDFDNDDDDDVVVEAPVPASEDPSEDLLTIVGVLALAEELGWPIARWRLRQAIAADVFPGARKVKARWRGPRVWAIPRSEALAWLKRHETETK